MAVIDESAYARPDKCRFCGHKLVKFDWGQCIECGLNGPMWVCAQHWQHGWPVDEHVHRERLDRTPSWDRETT